MIELKIIANDPHDLRAQLAALLGTTSPTAVLNEHKGSGTTVILDANLTAPLAEPAKRGRPAKSATAAEAPAPQATAASSASGGGTATEAGSAATGAGTGQTGSDEPQGEIAYDTHIKPAILDVSANHGGREAVLKLLSDFNVDHASKLTPEQWPALLEKVAELRAAA